MTVQNIIDSLELLAPLDFKEEYDNPGLQVGFAQNEVTGVLVCLDVTEAVVDEAARKSCNLIVSHHPLLYRPLNCVSDRTYQQRCVVKALACGVSIYSSHTNLDSAKGGVNYKIAELLGMENLVWLSPSSTYDAGLGVVGKLRTPLTDGELTKSIKSIFKCDCIQHSAFSGKLISKVALCGGSGASFMHDAKKFGADCYITGELRYHDYFDNDGMFLAALGHYESEQYTIDVIADYLKDHFPELNVLKTEINTNAVFYD